MADFEAQDFMQNLVDDWCDESTNFEKKENYNIIEVTRIHQFSYIIKIKAAMFSVK